MSDGKRGGYSFLNQFFDVDEDFNEAEISFVNCMKYAFSQSPDSRSPMT
jgi:hypothetical protein